LVYGIPYLHDWQGELGGWQIKKVHSGETLEMCQNNSKLQNFELGFWWWFGHVTNPLEWPLHHVHQCQLEEEELHEVVFSALSRSLPLNEWDFVDVERIMMALMS
jgi:hypothetical protein